MDQCIKYVTMAAITLKNEHSTKKGLYGPTSCLHYSKIAEIRIFLANHIKPSCINCVLEVCIIPILNY